MSSWGTPFVLARPTERRASPASHSATLLRLPPRGPRIAAALHWTSASFVVLAAVALPVLAPAAQSEVQNRWRGDYETGDLSQWRGAQALPGRITIVRSPVREGTYAARFVVRPGDKPINASGERTEVFTHTGESEGSESWWAWSTLFPDEFDPHADTEWNVFTQWHQTGRTCVQPTSFHVDTEARPATVALRVSGGSLSACRPAYERRFVLAELDRNRWYDFLFHVRWSADPDVGFVEVWLNGLPVVPKTHTATLYSGMGVYLKQGFYRGRYPRPTVVYHDGTRRGSSFPDVGSEVVVWKQPRILDERRVDVWALAPAGTRIGITIRDGTGRLLGFGRTTANRFGQARRKVALPAWSGQRRLTITLTGSGRERASRVVVVKTLSPRELRILRRG